MQTHISQLEVMTGNADGIGHNLHCIDVQPTSQFDDVETLNVQKREAMYLSPRKKKRHESLRGQFHPAVKSRR